MRSLLAVLVFCVSVSVFAQPSGGSLYLLGHDDGKWCGFRTEQLWNAEKKSMANVLQFGKVDYVNGRVTFVYVTIGDESGDWTTIDKYTLDKDEALTSLERTIVIPDGLKQEQLWSIRNGHATEEKSTNRNLATNAVVPDGDITVPDTEEVITKMQNFPFWPLMREKRPDVLSKGRVCLDGKQ
jgi:hypothetical protein